MVVAVANHKVTLNTFISFCEEVNKLLADGKDLNVDVKEWRQKRSLSQNALYWKWLEEISKQAKVQGKVFDSETWHQYFLKYYCPSKSIQMPAGENSLVKSTKKLDKGEMHHYLFKIELWAQDKGIILTIPSYSEYSKLTEQQNR